MGRPPAASVLGAAGPVVVLTGPAASFVDELRRTAPLELLEQLKARHRDHWADIHPELTAVGVVAAHWQQSPTRHNPAGLHDITASSEEIGTGRAAALLQVDGRTVQRMIRDGRLPGRKEGGRWLVPRSAITAAPQGDTGGQHQARPTRRPDRRPGRRPGRASA